MEILATIQASPGQDAGRLLQLMVEDMAPQAATTTEAVAGLVVVPGNW
jgi:hypothetical protein